MALRNNPNDDYAIAATPGATPTPGATAGGPQQIDTRQHIMMRQYEEARQRD